MLLPEDLKFGIELEYEIECGCECFCGSCDCRFDFFKNMIRPIIKKEFGSRSLIAQQDACHTWANYKRWHLKTDASLIELCSPVLTLKKLEKISNVISEFSKKKQVVVSKETGFHIHVSSAGISEADGLACWLLVEPVVAMLFPTHRRKRSEHDILPYMNNVNLRKNKHNVAHYFNEYYDTGGRAAFSFNDSYQTFEFRIAEGTKNPADVCCWISFCVNLIIMFKEMLEDEHVLVLGAKKPGSMSLNQICKQFFLLEDDVKKWIRSRLKKNAPKRWNQFSSF